MKSLIRRVVCVHARVDSKDMKQTTAMPLGRNAMLELTALRQDLRIGTGLPLLLLADRADGPRQSRRHELAALLQERGPLAGECLQ
jgi:hypothetical protein